MPALRRCTAAVAALLLAGGSASVAWAEPPVPVKKSAAAKSGNAKSGNAKSKSKSSNSGPGDSGVSTPAPSQSAAAQTDPAADPSAAATPGPTPAISYPDPSGSTGPQTTTLPSIPVSTPEEAQTQADLVDAEDERILEVRSALSALLQAGGTKAARNKQPQIFSSSSGDTLVLPARNTTEPYTIKDLVAIGNGRYVHKLPDGSYLLGVHVFVADGAKLALRGPLTLRMGSLPGAFSSIVGFGGTIVFAGTKQAPVRVTSWNIRAHKPDTQVADGRAYIRAVGGEFKMRYTTVSDLGFWSGRTGGIALTGTDRPTSAIRTRGKTKRLAEKKARQKKSTQDTGSGSGDVETTPVGPGTASHVPADDLVTGAIRNSVIKNDAFGLFISGSNQTQIINDKITGSLVHGVFLHRFAKNATIERTTVMGSGGDGFVLSRATEKVRVDSCVSEGNGRNGFTLNGQALSDGPSPLGESLSVFGDSSVNRSIARNNGRYGIEVLGGSRLAVQTSQVIGGDMGIVVRAKASGVQISGNRLSGQKRQAIALRDGVTGAYVAGNTITGTATGIYLRDASSMVVGNKVDTAKVDKSHGITVVGTSGDTEITRNTLIGAGTSAVSTSRADDRVYSHNNDTEHWHDTSTFWTKVGRYLKPMNLIWAGVILLIILTAARSSGRGGSRRLHEHPYDKQRHLEERPAMPLRRRRAPQVPTMAGGRRS